MNIRPIILTALFTGGLICGLTVAIQAQDVPKATTAGAGSGGLDSPEINKKAAEKPVPRLPDGTPDLSGVWRGGGPIGDIAEGLMPGQKIIMKPWAEKMMASRKAADDPEANCLPTGVPRIAPYPWRILQTPAYGKATRLYFIFEGNIHSYRQIFMDGRKHPEDPNPTWYGNSIGHWDGDTLVIDTVGFNDRFWFDFKGHPHTTQLHTIERYTRVSYDTLQNVTTVIDPGAYEQPFTIKFDAKLQPGWDLMEYICNENNQDVKHIQGKAGL